MISERKNIGFGIDFTFVGNRRSGFVVDEKGKKNSNKIWTALTNGTPEYVNN